MVRPKTPARAAPVQPRRRPRRAVSPPRSRVRFAPRRLPPARVAGHSSIAAAAGAHLLRGFIEHPTGAGAKLHTGHVGDGGVEIGTAWRNPWIWPRVMLSKLTAAGQLSVRDSRLSGGISWRALAFFSRHGRPEAALCRPSTPLLTADVDGRPAPRDAKGGHGDEGYATCRKTPGNSFRGCVTTVARRRRGRGAGAASGTVPCCRTLTRHCAPASPATRERRTLT
jgi:hypothetical protein